MMGKEKGFDGIRIIEDYKKGLITISEAANQCNCTIWEMEKYLIEQGYKSEYSIEDLESELKFLK